ncbi:hypothetical protein LOTGIDRAFT_103410 [Lottia gigantea]|uniref:BTB domain-containing protein n=1 Tax=Lottia gigantea TaxID=225164 RepID=V4A1Z5_LOTGI|nr:hypothetical protein LOTGIDRAFT_103410 [Lottia gigantea]ESO97828.1 hypothetical protein LOTGIDRAFT_103410 [Lottia gigantea]
MELVQINVGGKVFLTTKSTLSKIPNTKLSDLKETSSHYRTEFKDFYFDRDPEAFSCILNLYRTSELHLTYKVCGNAIRTELEYWGIDVNIVRSCCWKKLFEVDEDETILKTLKKGISTCDVMYGDHSSSKRQILKNRIWILLDKPNSSTAAKIWNWIYLLLVIISAGIFCLETIAFRVPKSQIDGTNSTEVFNVSNPKIREFISTELHPALMIIEIICLIVFTLELALRSLCCPAGTAFLKSFLNIVDILTVLVGWTAVIVDMFFFFTGELETLLLANVSFGLRCCYILRLFRFFRLKEKYIGLKVMWLAILQSKDELMLLVISSLILSTILGSTTYYCELENPVFSSIPQAIWWAIITMTTVGYGDIYPISPIGKCVGTVCSLCGLLIISMPIAIIAANFNQYHRQNKQLQCILNDRYRSQIKTKKETHISGCL